MRGRLLVAGDEPDLVTGREGAEDFADLGFAGARAYTDPPATIVAEDLARLAAAPKRDDVIERQRRGATAQRRRVDVDVDRHVGARTRPDARRSARGDRLGDVID